MHYDAPPPYSCILFVSPTKNKDDPKDDNNPNNEDNPRNEDDPKNENNPKIEKHLNFSFDMEEKLSTLWQFWYRVHQNWYKVSVMLLWG